jgi:hypothetical protein
LRLEAQAVLLVLEYKVLQVLMAPQVLMVLLVLLEQLALLVSLHHGQK